VAVAQSGPRVSACPACSSEVPAGAKFCPECGAGVGPRLCPSCGAPAERGRFCMECGAAIPGDPVKNEQPSYAPVSERRVTSVLFGDLVGFTTLSEARDPEEVRELLSRYFAECRTVIGRYGGTVEKFIGDAVMAVWGVPVAHEDDAERAVRAGLELVQTVAGIGSDVGAPDLAMRVGVVTGEVAVTLGATSEGMVAGDAVNTAARVQTTAGPGQVFVDDVTNSLTSAAIAYSDAGSHELKGKAEPLHLWQARTIIAEVGGGSRVDGLEAPLTGRDRELRLLKELFHATQESARPRLIVLDGEAGVGKTRLAWEFEKYVDGLTATVRWHRGRCLSYGDGVAFWALSEAVRSRLGLTESDSGDAVSERLDEGLEQYVPDLEEREWLRPRVASLVGVGGGASFPRQDLFAAWTTFLERVAQSGTAVVLLIEDAQFADDGLLDFVDHLLATAPAGIFVLTLARPELLVRRPSFGGRRCTVVRLDPLDDSAMATLVDGLVAGLPATTRDALVTLAEGVPLFAVETVRALIDRDAVVPKDGQYVPADGVTVDLATIGAPASLQALVAARLDALTQAERLLVADASVLGAAFTRAGLISITGESDDLNALLESLQRKEIIAVQHDRFAAERGQFRFVQAVVRQVAYGTQSKRDRRRRHLLAAEHLKNQVDENDDLSVVIAQHLLDAVDAESTGDIDTPALAAEACVLLERAANRAKSLGSPAEALRLLGTALVRISEPIDRARIALAAAQAALDAGRYSEAIDHAAAAAALYDSLSLAIDAGVAIGVQARSLVISSQPAAALAIAQPRWSALEGMAGAEPALLWLSLALMAGNAALGNTDAAGIFVEKRLYLAEAAGKPSELCHTLNAMGVKFATTGAPAMARGCYEAAARIAREHDLPGDIAQALNNLVTVLASRDLSAALDTAREGLDMAHRSGVVGMIDYMTGNYFSSLWTSGRIRDAVALLVQSKNAITTPTAILGNVSFECWIADAVGGPMPPEPSTDLVGGSWDRAIHLHIQIRLATANGDTARAALLAPEALATALEAGGLDDDFMHFWPLTVEAAMATRNLDLAVELMKPVTDARPGIVTPAISAHLLRLQALLSAARGESTIVVADTFRSAITAFDRFGAVAYRSHTQAEFGQWLMQQGRASETSELFAAARSFYEHEGAQNWLARLDSWASTTVSAGN
jgi:class 3 adenylate cyclase/tetratricopeptide (TPR) repeat protein